MAKRYEEKKKRSIVGLLLKLAMVAVCVYLLAVFIGGQFQVMEKRRQLDGITARVEQQAERNSELQRLMDSGDEDAYVERVAREKLHYAWADEEVFVDITGE